MNEAKRIFTYQEALETLPRVQELTRQAVHDVEVLFQRVNSREELDRQERVLTGLSQLIIKVWRQRMEELGCEVKGLWLVDFDNGSGYYCWRYPEESLAHFHGYDEGFAGRTPIQ
jgi:hypothetical protein